MELKIFSPTEDGFIKEIKWNHEQIKAEVAEKVSYYANLVYTDDQIKEAKADRAKLNKFVQALEAKRKEVKKQCMAPYEDFEKKMKEIIAIVNEPIQMIDQQVKGYEDQKKAEKLEKIKEYWQAKEKPFAIELERVMDARWLNASVSLKSVQGAIDALLDQIEKDLSTLQDLPEFSFEAVETYKTTLDLGKAIQEGHRLADIQKRKAEHDARMKAEEERRMQEAEARKKAALEENRQEADSLLRQEEYTDIPEKTQQPDKQWLSFKALLSVDDAMALKSFFESRNIEFEEIKKGAKKSDD